MLRAYILLREDRVSVCCEKAACQLPPMGYIASRPRVGCRQQPIHVSQVVARWWRGGGVSQAEPGTSAKGHLADGVFCLLRATRRICRLYHISRGTANSEKGLVLFLGRYTPPAISPFHYSSFAMSTRPSCLMNLSCFWRGRALVRPSAGISAVGTHSI